ncbi:hypothetical protein GGX14DRAFT_593570 [Mycena pura]|uniref:Uncharacterized protein n=1 Tax=Mycena pura TaxID=153505 RepID=A0AAD6URF6_9AGAR|nr:hypothetical protein GGX14DRAFT_593570 [Mycena pura]
MCASSTSMPRAAAAFHLPAHAPLSVRGLGLDASCRRCAELPSHEHAWAQFRRPAPPPPSTAPCNPACTVAMRRAQACFRRAAPLRLPPPTTAFPAHAPMSVCGFVVDAPRCRCLPLAACMNLFSTPAPPTPSTVLLPPSATLRRFVDALCCRRLPPPRSFSTPCAAASFHRPVHPRRCLHRRVPLSVHPRCRLHRRVPLSRARARSIERYRLSVHGLVFDARTTAALHRPRARSHERAQARFLCPRRCRNPLRCAGSFWTTRTAAAFHLPTHAPFNACGLVLDAPRRRRFPAHTPC